MVVREGLWLVGAGLAVGIALSALTAMALGGLLYQVSALDPITFVSAPLLLAIASLLACYFPARRAMRVTPLRALRTQ